MTFNNSRENKLKRKLSQSSTSSSLSQSSASNNNSELLGNTNDAASASSKEDTELFNAITVQLGGKWKEICSQSPLLQARGSGMISQRWKTKIRYFVG
ncbi:7200_t:CDS:2 [Entrophospora sp. SA101]|nr:11571_t:CDS:2 [Entrophospora candida]CAH1760591.1 10745_t:CDS:2 [Entrophospora sp. SA101]CAJ0748044.1 7200_t:CDS:2 [Entrophospora sp. SA101]